MKHRLRLFVTGRTAGSLRAIAHAEALQAQRSDELEVEVEVVDVLEHPDLAAAAGVLATPTLVRQRPLPERRVVGDLSDRDKVLTGLDLALR